MTRSVRVWALLLLTSILVGGLGLPASAHDRVIPTEGEFIQVINQERAKRGLPRVVSHSGLRVQTWQHSRDMAQQGFFDHRGFQDRVNNAQPDPPEPNGPPDDGFGGACENLAKFSDPFSVSDSQAAQRFFDLWLNSEPHRECMFDQAGFTATAIGIGVWHTDAKNEWHATMIHVADSTPPGGEGPNPCENATEPFGPGDDTITGTTGDDVLCGGGGDDVIRGLGGDDLIIGGPGDDILRGGAGDDTLRGSGDHDTLLGGPGNDTLNGQAGNDDLRAHGGDDTLAGGPGNDELFAGPGVDTLRGQGGEDTLRGHAGNDKLLGGPDGDLMLGGLDDDTLRGHGGQDRFNGGPGNDACIDFDPSTDIGAVNC